MSLTPDCPVLENGLVRVRFDPINVVGFRVDVWNGTTYVEQGKITVFRLGDTNGYDDTWVSAGLVEYTPDRAVAQVVFSRAADPYSRERIYITVQRGEFGAQFECYPAPKSTGSQADASFTWTPVSGDANASMMKNDSQATPPSAAGTAAYVSTAGTGSALFGAFGNLGASSFNTSENYVSILRCISAYNVVGPFQHTLVVVQKALNAGYGGVDSSAYGVNANNCGISGVGGLGYVQAQVYFTPTQAQQVMEAEAMTLGTNWTSVTDASASGGQAAKTTQTSDVGAISQAAWPNGFLGTYRLFIRAQATVNSTVYAITTGQATPVGDPVTIVGQATPVYSWYDLGEIVANNVPLAIRGWCNTAGRLQIDRVEAILTQDRSRSGAIFAGSRDAGQAALYDARTLGALVAR